VSAKQHPVQPPRSKETRAVEEALMMLVGKWLKGIGLDYAVPTFEAAGIVTAEALSELDPTHFESLGVTSPDDRRKLFFLVQRVKQAQKSEQRESSAKVSPKKAVAETKAATATATSAQPASDTTTSNSKAVAKGTTTAASAAVAATQSQDSSTSKLVKPKNGSATAAATRARTTAAAVAPSRQERTSRNATKGGSVVKKEEEEEDRPGSDADDANGVPARQNDDEENEEAVVPIVRSASSYDDDEDSEEVPRRRTSTSSTAANRRLSGVPMPSKRRTSGHKGRAGGGGESSTSETTTTMAASEMMSTRTGKALSSIPAESVAPMSPLVNISLAMDDDRRKNDGRADLSREKLRDMGQVTQRTARRASSMRSRSEEEDSNQSADADSSASALPNRPAAKTENHRLSRAQSLQNGHDRAGSGHECPPASSNPFAAQIERLREQNAAATAASGSSTQSQQSFRIDPSQRVSVVVRKRPASHDVDMLQVLPPNRLLVYQPRTRVDLRREIATTSFRFDAVVDEVTSNTAVYENVVRPLLPNLARGQNSTVFCFGQTNSGKTHTLLGTTTTTTAAPSNDDEGSGATDHGRDAPFVRSKVAEPGLYYLAAVDIFDMLSEMEGLSVVVSLLELYDRKVLDLLNDRAPVPCWEDGSGKVQFPGLSLHPVYSAEQLQRLIEQGHALRSIGTTSKNSESSRSHAVLQLHINQAQNRKHRRYATMTFIDLGTLSFGTVGLF
jgi:Kinesin motor domain/SAM domain (Sterile alpha motif)